MNKKPEKPKVVQIKAAQEKNEYAFDKFEKSLIDAINQAYKDGVPYALVIYALHMYLQIETSRVWDEDD